MTLVYLGWNDLEVPSSVDVNDSMAVGLMAENSVFSYFNAMLHDLFVSVPCRYGFVGQ